MKNIIIRTRLDKSANIRKNIIDNIGINIGEVRYRLWENIWFNLVGSIPHNISENIRQIENIRAEIEDETEKKFRVHLERNVGDVLEFDISNTIFYNTWRKIVGIIPRNTITLTINNEKYRRKLSK